MQRQLKGIALLIFGVIVSMPVASGNPYFWVAGIVFGFLGLILVFNGGGKED